MSTQCGKVIIFSLLLMVCTYTILLYITVEKGHFGEILVSLLEHYFIVVVMFCYYYKSYSFINKY